MRVLNGKVFGKLTVISLHHHRTKHKNTLWICRCSCGEMTVVSSPNLLKGHTKSCGCLLYKRQPMLHREQAAWRRMISRCTYIKDIGYRRYGGRGITVCDEWLMSFDAFIRDMGMMPFSRAHLERIDNNGNYEKNNCRWATCLMNNRNTSKSKRWYIKGKVFESSTEAASYFGVTHRTIINWCLRFDDCYSELKYASS